MKVLILTYPQFKFEEIEFLTHLKRELDVYIISVSGEAAPLDKNIPEATQLTVADAMKQKFDLLLILGGASVLESNIYEDDGFHALLKHLTGYSTQTVSIGTGSVLLARTGLLDGMHAAIPTRAHANQLRAKWPGVQWEDIKIVKTGQFWTSAEGSTEDIRSLALIFNMACKGNTGWIYPTFLMASNRPILEDDVSIPNSQKKVPFPGQSVCQEILTSTDDRDVVDHASNSALRLAMESFVRPCNMILTTMFSALPNSASMINPYLQQGLELLWHESGLRPETPWIRPDIEELKERTRNDDWPENQLDAAEEVEVLDTLTCQIELGDMHCRPYSLETAIALALKHGRDNEAQRWTTMLAIQLRDYDIPVTWLTTGKSASLTKLMLAGGINRVTGRTEEMAIAEAEQISQALREWPVRRAERSTRRSQGREEIQSDTYAQLLERINGLKDTHQKTLLKTPATTSELRVAEERLGVELPDDYKSVLRVSNGLDFIPSKNAPGLRSVDQLRWEEAKDIGLEKFQVDLGAELDPVEAEKMPKFGRILIVSDEADEELVWLVEPEQMRQAKDVIRKERGETHGSGGADQWGVVFWVHWMTELQWHGNFREYLESLIV